MFGLTEADEARFWEKIDIRSEDECWPWVAKSRHHKGYGLFGMANGRSGGVKLVASRVACYLGHGAAPNGLSNALHSCDNPPCCNPKHLRWGTQKQNSADAVARGRASRPPVNTPGRNVGKMPMGCDVWNQSLNEIIVREIWRLHLAGGMTTTQIATTVKAKKHAVADVVRGRSWRHLNGAPSIEALKAGGVRRGVNQFSDLLETCAK